MKRRFETIMLSLMLVSLGEVVVVRPAAAQFDPVTAAVYFKGGEEGARKIVHFVQSVRSLRRQWWVIEYADGFCLFNHVHRNHSDRVPLAAIGEGVDG